MSTLKIPKLIRVERKGDTAQVFIDGEEFPFHIAREPIDINVDPDSLAAVRFTVFSERVEVEDGWSKEPRVTAG